MTFSILVDIFYPSAGTVFSKEGVFQQPQAISLTTPAAWVVATVGLSQTDYSVQSLWMSRAMASPWSHMLRHITRPLSRRPICGCRAFVLRL
jgi:hypothetical protein